MSKRSLEVVARAALLMMAGWLFVFAVALFDTLAAATFGTARGLVAFAVVVTFIWALVIANQSMPKE